MNIERWNAMLHELGAPPEANIFSQLQSAYSEKHRRYHTSRHIEDCLSLFDEIKYLAERPAEVECALWFHDAIYRPMSKLNEERSADWASVFGRSAGIAPDVVARICTHIMATRHLSPSTGGDSSLVVDIDLAILGAVPGRYNEFESDIRKEYRWVPGFIYNPKRASILQSFLDRPRIYHWAPVYDRFEGGARMNISEAIRALRGVS